MDTTAPDHTGQISVSLSGDNLIASWSSGDFLDLEDYYNLTYYFAIGKYCILLSMMILA